LRFSHNRGVVESRVFLKNVFDEIWFREKINDYLKLNNINKFKEYGREKGVIVMFFSEVGKLFNNNIVNIGIRGGGCKLFNGYVFLFFYKKI
jgi:hypothetical protein